MEEPEMPGMREKAIVSVITLLTVAMWLTTPLHGIHVAAISLIWDQGHRTLDATRAALDEAGLAGADRVLPKPVSARTLGEAISSLVREAVQELDLQRAQA